MIKYARRKVDVRVTSDGAEIEIICRKGKPELDDSGYWLNHGETATVPMVEGEYLYVRGNRRHSQSPTLTLDE